MRDTSCYQCAHPDAQGIHSCSLGFGVGGSGMGYGQRGQWGGMGQMMTLQQHNTQVELNAIHSRKPAGVLCGMGCGVEMVLLDDPNAQCDVRVQCPNCNSTGIKKGNRP